MENIQVLVLEGLETKMIEFIESCELVASASDGQLELFSTYTIMPGDIGLIVAENERSVSFLIGNACLSIEKAKEDIKYVRTPSEKTESTIAC